MEKYVITTENTADLPYSYYKEHQVEYMYLTYQLDGITYNKENELDFKEFYSRMRAGSMPTTSQVNSEEAKDVLRPLLEAGNDVLHLAFSSGLSGSYNSVRLAAEELKEEYPDRKILVVDSLCASLGEGLFVYKAVQMKEAGASVDEVAAWLEEHGRPFWLRYVLVPGISDAEEDIRALGEHFGNGRYRMIQRVEILPYHTLGKNKYEVLGWDYKLKDTPLNTKEQLDRAKGLFDRYFDCAVLN